MTDESDLTGTRVTDWCIDVIEQLVLDGFPNEQTRDTLARLAGVEPQRETLSHLAKVGVLVIRSLEGHFAARIEDEPQPSEVTRELIRTIRERLYAIE